MIKRILLRDAPGLQKAWEGKSPCDLFRATHAHRPTSPAPRMQICRTFFSRHLGRPPRRPGTRGHRRPRPHLLPPSSSAQTASRNARGQNQHHHLTGVALTGCQHTGPIQGGRRAFLAKGFPWSLTASVRFFKIPGSREFSCHSFLTRRVSPDQHPAGSIHFANAFLGGIPAFPPRRQLKAVLATAVFEPLHIPKICSFPFLVFPFRLSATKLPPLG